MRSNEVAQYIEKIAPLSCALEGDNNGIVYGNPEKEIGIIGVTWSPTLNVLIEACKTGIDMLIIHESLFFKPHPIFKGLPEEEKKPNVQRKEILDKFQIVVYRAHTSWDFAEVGNNSVLAKKLHLNNLQKFDFGLVGDYEHPKLFKEFAKDVDRLLSLPFSVKVGNPKKIIKKIAIVAGSGLRSSDIPEIASNLHADVLVSSELHDSTARFAREIDIALIDVGCYYSEIMGMQNLALELQKLLPDIKIAFIDSKPDTWL